MPLIYIFNVLIKVLTLGSVYIHSWDKFHLYKIFFPQQHFTGIYTVVLNLKE